MGSWVFCVSLFWTALHGQILQPEKTLLWSSALLSRVNNTLIPGYQYYLALVASAVAVLLGYGLVYFPGDCLSLISLAGTANWRHVFPGDSGSTSKRRKGKAVNYYDCQFQGSGIIPTLLCHREAVDTGYGCRHCSLLMIAFRYSTS